MAGKFLELAFTPTVRAAQAKFFGRAQSLPPQRDHDALTDDEAQFIKSRDSFYMATVTETGWPYVQHRGGPPGFLRVVSPTQLAFADYKGNRQMLSTGNLAVNDRVCLFLMDYTEDTEWRNRAEFLQGRAQVVEFLRRKWNRELDYRLKKALWAFTGNRIAMRFEYEFHDDSGQWYRAHGNEMWEFDELGYMKYRYASINDQPILESERKIHSRFPA
ncbi:MAG: DUF1348 family protein [Verrucomicrobiota bacterium]